MGSYADKSIFSNSALRYSNARLKRHCHGVLGYTWFKNRNWYLMEYSLHTKKTTQMRVGSIAYHIRLLKRE